MRSSYDIICFVLNFMWNIRGLRYLFIGFKIFNLHNLPCNTVYTRKICQTQKPQIIFGIAVNGICSKLAHAD